MLHDVPETTAFRQKRTIMVRDQLAGRGIAENRILSVMASIPRELFVPDPIRANAYDDSALPIPCNQTISQPFIVAYMTQQLEPDPADRILEIGTGTGYQTAILARLCRQVYSVERIPSLAQSARDRLFRLGVTNVTILAGDGTLGFPPMAPFNRIMVTAAAPSIPDALIEQLQVGGRLIAPVGGSEIQRLTLLDKQLAQTSETPLIECRFVKLIGQSGWKP